MGLGGINPIKPAQPVNADNLPQQQYVTPANASPNTTSNADVRFATPDLLNLMGQKLELPSKAVPPPADGNPAEPALSREAQAMLSAKQLPAVNVANPEQLAAELKTLLTRPAPAPAQPQPQTQAPAAQTQLPQDTAQFSQPNRPEAPLTGTQTYSRESLLARARPETPGTPAQNNPPAAARPQAPQNPAANILATPKETAAALLKTLPDPLGPPLAQNPPATSAPAGTQPPRDPNLPTLANVPRPPAAANAPATANAPAVPPGARPAAQPNAQTPASPNMPHTPAAPTTPPGPVLVSGKQTFATPDAAPRQPMVDFSGTRRADSVRLQILRSGPDAGKLLATQPAEGGAARDAAPANAAQTAPHAAAAALPNNAQPAEAQRAEATLPLRPGAAQSSDLSTNYARPQAAQQDAVFGNEPLRQEMQLQPQAARAPLAAGSFLINSSPLSHAFLSIQQEEERHGRVVNPGQPPPISVSLDIHTPHAGLVKIRLALSGLNLTGNMTFASSAWADEAAQALPRLEAALSSNVGLQNPSLTVQVDPESRWGTYADGV